MWGSGNRVGVEEVSNKQSSLVLPSFQHLLFAGTASAFRLQEGSVLLQDRRFGNCLFLTDARKLPEKRI